MASEPTRKPRERPVFYWNDSEIHQSQPFPPAVVRPCWGLRAVPPVAPRAARSPACVHQPFPLPFAVKPSCVGRGSRSVWFVLICAGTRVSLQHGVRHGWSRAALRPGQEAEAAGALWTCALGTWRPSRGKPLPNGEAAWGSTWVMAGPPAASTPGDTVRSRGELSPPSPHLAGL